MSRTKVVPDANREQLAIGCELGNVRVAIATPTDVDEAEIERAIDRLERSTLDRLDRHGPEP